MKPFLAVSTGICLLGIVVLGATRTSLAHDDTQSEPARESTAPKLKAETLLHNELEGAENTEVIVSRTTMPPNTTLPKHWHPGEEFAYVLEGSVILWMEGEEELTVKPGDVIKIPLKQIHTAITKDEGATVLVFRVHEKGKPERVLVD